MSSVFRTGVATWTRRGLVPALLLAAALRASGQCLPEQVQQLTASDAGRDDNFGIGIATDGTTLLIAASTDDTPGGANGGSVFVFVRTNGQWVEQAQLIPEDSAAQDLFGHSLAVSGDTAVVGAFADDHAAGVNAGSVYVFTRAAGTWTQQVKLIASDAAPNDQFGAAVALSGDTLLIGASADDDVGANSGSVYVFRRLNGIWTQQAKLLAADASAGDLFGGQIAMSEDTAVIAAGCDDDRGTDAGAAYVFVRAGNGWSQQAKLTASDGHAGDHFASPAISGDTIAIGADRGDVSGATDAGLVYVFVRSGTVWSQQGRLSAPDAEASDWLGHSVAIVENTLVSGAHNDDFVAGGADDHMGSVYVFLRVGPTWTLDAKLGRSLPKNPPTSARKLRYSVRPRSSGRLA